MIVRDDLKAMGINTKHFTRWLQKLTNDGLVTQNGDHLTLHSHHKLGKKVGRLWGIWGARPHNPHFSPVYTQKVGRTPETRISTGRSRV